MTGAWQDILDRFIDDRFSEIVNIRRHLHMNPELSGDERGTSLYLYQKLGDEGFKVRFGPEGRGVLADSARSHRPERRQLLPAARIMVLV